MRHAKVEKLINGNVTRCDVTQPQILPDMPGKTFGVVEVGMVMESITEKKAEWQQYLSNVIRVIKPGGRLIMTVIREAADYRVGNYRFPALSLKESEVLAELKKLGLTDISVDKTLKETEETNKKERLGYKGIMFFTARMPE